MDPDLPLNQVPKPRLPPISSAEDHHVRFNNRIHNRTLPATNQHFPTQSHHHHQHQPYPPPSPQPFHPVSHLHPNPNTHPHNQHHYFPPHAYAKQLPPHVPIHSNSLAYLNNPAYHHHQIQYGHSSPGLASAMIYGSYPPQVPDHEFMHRHLQPFNTNEYRPYPYSYPLPPMPNLQLYDHNQNYYDSIHSVGQLQFQDHYTAQPAGVPHHPPPVPTFHYNEQPPGQLHGLGQCVPPDGAYHGIHMHYYDQQPCRFNRRLHSPLLPPPHLLCTKQSPSRIPSPICPLVDNSNIGPIQPRSTASASDKCSEHSKNPIHSTNPLEFPLEVNTIPSQPKPPPRPRRDYFVFSAITYELMVRALRADRGLPEYPDSSSSNNAVSKNIPLFSAHHPATLTRKKWMRLKSRLVLHEELPSRRCLTWKSCSLIIVPEEDWAQVVYESHVKQVKRVPTSGGHNSFNLTYLTLRKQYQTRRSRCGIPREASVALFSSCTQCAQELMMKVKPADSVSLQAKEEEEEEESESKSSHNPGHDDDKLTSVNDSNVVEESSISGKCPNQKRARSAEPETIPHPVVNKKSCITSIPIGSLLSSEEEPLIGKIDSAAELGE